MRLFFVIFSSIIFLSSSIAQAEAPMKRFVVYYDKGVPSTSFMPYDLIVFDSDHHPDIRPLKEQGKTVLGYISLGEVEDYRFFFKRMKERGLVLHPNKNWPGTYFVDIRNPAWTKAVVEDLIPKILSQGFAGIFIDTLDSPIELERINPKKYNGMKEASKEIIRAIRYQYPQIKIMLNRAYQLVPEVGSDIDYLLAESLYADYNFDTKKYQKVKKQDYEEQLNLLDAAKKQYPDLEIYTLDYADREDTQARREIYAVQRKNGFVPYVATIGLNQLVEEPER